MAVAYEQRYPFPYLQEEQNPLSLLQGGEAGLGKLSICNHLKLLQTFMIHREGWKLVFLFLLGIYVVLMEEKGLNREPQK